jgi:hypothetical protein
MSNTDEGVLTDIKRLPNSLNGNPRYALTLDNGNHYNTRADGQVGFDLQNYQFEGCTVRLLINGRGTVFDISVI